MLESITPKKTKYYAKVCVNEFINHFDDFSTPLVHNGAKEMDFQDSEVSRILLGRSTLWDGDKEKGHNSRQ